MFGVADPVPRSRHRSDGLIVRWCVMALAAMIGGPVLMYSLLLPYIALPDRIVGDAKSAVLAVGYLWASVTYPIAGWCSWRWMTPWQERRNRDLAFHTTSIVVAVAIAWIGGYATALVAAAIDQPIPLGVWVCGLVAGAALGWLLRRGPRGGNLPVEP